MYVFIYNYSHSTLCLLTYSILTNEVRMQRVFVIESHRPAVLKSLLQRSDVVHRDMFWACYPSKWNDYYSGGYISEIPQLHHFGSDSDLSFVGREDCGHMRVDVELQTQFDVLCKPDYSTAYILVSLPMMARWHSTGAFNAEHILKQSGQFHYSEPQFYHLP